MWRSWVDRINASNKAASPVGSRPQSMEALPSPDILKRRGREQAELRDLWKQSQDLLNDQEHQHSVFLEQFLPQFCSFWENDSSGHVFIAIDDARSFMSCLSRLLVSGIGKVSDMSKAESSQVLLNNIRSKSHLFNVVRAFYVIAHGPDHLVNFMLQQRVPSVIIKLFRSSMDLPSSYEHRTLLKDNSQNEDGHLENSGQDDSDLVSLDEASQLMAKTLKQFVQNQTILRRLMVEDVLVMMINLVSFQPASPSENDTDPAYMREKQRVIQVLKAVPTTADVYQYLRSRHCIDTLVQQWKERLTKSQLNAIDLQEIALGADLVAFQLKGSMDIEYFGLLEDFDAAGALNVLKDAVVAEPFDDARLQQKIKLAQIMAKMVFIGKRDRSPITLEGLPYQHPDFVLPKTDGPKDKMVQNRLAFEHLLTMLTFTHTTQQSNTESMHHDQLLKALRKAIFWEIKTILEMHAANYFLLEHLNALPQMIETMEYDEPEIQEGILDLLVYVMRDLNFVPLKELAVISFHFQNTSSGRMISRICRRFADMLRGSDKFLVVVREAGLINVISLMLSDITEELKANPMPNPLPKEDENRTFMQNVLADFDAVSDCLLEMIKDTTNATIFSKTYRGNLLDFLQVPSARSGTLRIFESLSGQVEELQPGSPFSFTSTLQSTSNDIQVAFSRLMETIQGIPREDYAFRLDILKTIQRIFAAHPSTRDIFRQVGGYVTLVSMVVSLEGAFNDDTEKDTMNAKPDHAEHITSLFRAIFAVLAESMRDHDVNRQYFVQHVGYTALENALMVTGILGPSGMPRFAFGVLFSFAVENTEFSDIFLPLGSSDDTQAPRNPQQKIDDMLKNATVIVKHPETIPMLFRLQKHITFDEDLAYGILSALHALAKSNRRNQIEINKSGMIMAALQRLFSEHENERPDLVSRQSKIILDTIKKLLAMGISYNEIRFVFQRFHLNPQSPDQYATCSALMDLILQGAKRSRWPNFIQFDMSTYGYAGLEVPSLSWFPQSSLGYTLMMWFHIERADPIVPMVLFSLWNGQDVVFKVHIHASTRRLQIQQSNHKQTVEFTSFEFQPGYWYHIGLVHNKPRLGSNSNVIMYINGVQMEQMRCPYIAQPQADTILRAMIGTPKELGTPSRLMWDLGPTYMVQDTLEPDLLSLYFNLGARYNALFQDTLRQFQTYEASTALFINIRNMARTLGRKDMSNTILANVMQGNGSMSLAENKIVFAFFANNALYEGTGTGLTESGLSQIVSQRISNVSDRNRMVLNTAIPKIEVAMSSLHRMGYLCGDPVVAYPSGVDEALWKIGGCAIALQLIERSETSEALYKSTAILFEMIRYSWRNSEDMERRHGYEVLAYLLKQKRALLTTEIFESLLVFIGKDAAYPENSLINNPFAYRYVVLNFEIWKKTNADLQKAQLDQFILFLQTSRRRQFNMKRLQKFQLVKKMLLAFRMNIYSKELIPHAIHALKTVMVCSWSAESVRAVATFLVSTVSKAQKNHSQNDPMTPSPTPDHTSSFSFNAGKEGELVDKPGLVFNAKEYPPSGKAIVMRNIVLEMLHDILCDPENKNFVAKFSATITNRWLLIFFAPNLNPYTVLLATRILGRILVCQGQLYIQRFRVASEGFLVMKKLLAQYWFMPQLEETLFVIMMGRDIADYPIYPTFDIHHLKRSLKQSKTKMLIPDILPILISFFNEESYTTVDGHGVGSPTSIASPVRPYRAPFSRDAPTAIADIARTHGQYIRLLRELFDESEEFRDLCCKSEAIDALIEILYRAITPAGIVTADDELALRDNPLTPVSANPMSVNASEGGNGSLHVDTRPNLVASQSSVTKRGGASTLVTKTSPHSSRKVVVNSITKFNMSSGSNAAGSNIVLKDIVLEAILELVVAIGVRSVIGQQSKNLDGLTLILNSFPPSVPETQMTFESFLLTHVAQSLKTTLQCDDTLMADGRVLNSVGRFCQLATDAVSQGRFVNGAEQIYDLLASVLESLHANNFYGRQGPNAQTVAGLYRGLNRMIVFKILELEENGMVTDQIIAFLNYCIHHQRIILSPRNADLEFLRCFCYHLYQFLLMENDDVKQNAANIWKLLLLQKPDDVASIFRVKAKGIETEELILGFRQMLEMDMDSFFMWVEARQLELNLLFREHIFKAWEHVVLQENKYNQETIKDFEAKRINKLKKMQKQASLESNLMQEFTIRTAAWSKSINDVEMSRFTKALQDNDGHDNFIQSEWTRFSEELTQERALWGSAYSACETKWRLDDTEGRHRMRKKIQRIPNARTQAYLPKQTSPSLYESNSTSTSNGGTLTLDPDKDFDANKSASLGMDGSETRASVENTSDQPQSAQDTETGDDTRHLDDEDDEIAYEEDKNRKVLRLLDQGDLVLDVYNVSQISGLDTCESLLLLCKNNIYLIDNFFQRQDGEVVEIWNVPQEERDQYLILLARAAGMETDPAISTSGDLHTCRKWANSDIKEVYKRRFLFRDVAIEMFFADGRNALITVERDERDELYTKIASRVTQHDDQATSIVGGASDKDGSGFKLSSIFGSSTLSELTQKWERREITNFQYLMYLNAIAGRSYNDLTQYPVFPWILADYESEELDLNNPKTFRDLRLPMGAQTPERRNGFAERYKEWGEANNLEPAFHYGTHYSSAMIVCSFLIRLEPFTQHYLKLQGGTFDHADRLFDSVGKAWESASEKNMGDVRELIPEFFYLPEFLENVNKFDFGSKQGTGETIDSVLLPPWAHGDPKMFIHLHRKALESDYVSENLNHWIDLIFGYKQQGQRAIEALNVFHHLSYEGAVDLDAITDLVEKTATIGIINNFGQTPRQLFKKPHPPRAPRSQGQQSQMFYPLQDHADKLVQSILPVRDIKRQIGDMNMFNDKLGVTTCQQLFMPGDGSKYIEWGYSDGSLRLFSTETSKILHTFENMHTGYIRTAYFPDPRILVTGGTDNMVCMWNVKQEKPYEFTLLECLRGHTGPVHALAASKSYSILVSGSKDKTAIVWDLNRMAYVRSLEGHESTVSKVCVNDATGDIITCSSHIIRVWTINGDLYLTKPVCSSSDGLLSCTFYAGMQSEFCSHDVIVTGHQKGVIKIWIKDLITDAVTKRCRWGLRLIREIKHVDRFNPGHTDFSGIVSLLFTSKQTLLTGDMRGQVYAFVLPDTTDSLHYVKDDKYKECMDCRRVFSVLERKNHCKTCGGIFCSGCMSNSLLPTVDRSARFCKACHDTLS